MAKAKKKNPVSPVAPCLYPFLKKPDTRWNKDGEYRVTLVFDQDDPFIAKVEEKAKAAYEDLKKSMKPADKKVFEYISPVKEDKDEATGEPTGNVRLAFKSLAQYTDKKTDEVVKITMKVFDAQGKLINNLPNIGNGSKLSISFKPSSGSMKDKRGNIDFYYTLWMNAVQLVELVEYNADGSSYGFGKEEGGYEADDDNDFDSGSGGGDDPDDDKDNSDW